jgi:hypothetical protein
MSAGSQSAKGHQILQQVAAKAMDDDSYRQRLMSDPKTVLREEGLTVPDDVDVTVHEASHSHVHLVLPPGAPPSGDLDADEVDTRVLSYSYPF